MLERILEDGRKVTDAALERLLPAGSERPTSIHQAMRHSVFAGGKRIRPILCMDAGRAVAGVLPDGIEEVGAALEMLHTYSLIHDDLPALDNDDLRRGRPTCHKVFGEAIAILAGDALQTQAYETLARLRCPAEATLEYIHRSKTAALITSSVVAGGIYAGASVEQVSSLRCFGESIGLAFQIVDDLLDVTKTSAQLGKTAGKDVASEKATYPALFGLEESRKKADELLRVASNALDSFGERGDVLKNLARFLVERES